MGENIWVKIERRNCLLASSTEENIWKKLGGGLQFHQPIFTQGTFQYSWARDPTVRGPMQFANVTNMIIIKI